MIRVYYSILVLSLIIIVSSFKRNHIEPKTTNDIEFFKNETKNNPSSSKSMLVYDMIEKYSEEYNIPKHIAYNIAYKETKYRGPFHWNYDPHLTSSGGAEGPMQVMPATARGVNKRKITPYELRNDIELNISTSMKLLKILYNKSGGNWSLACGYYNTGKPIINSYASFCATNKNYTKNWIKQ